MSHVNHGQNSDKNDAFLTCLILKQPVQQIPQKGAVPRSMLMKQARKNKDVELYLSTSQLLVYFNAHDTFSKAVVVKSLFCCKVLNFFGRCDEVVVIKPNLHCPSSSNRKMNGFGTFGLARPLARR